MLNLRSSIILRKAIYDLPLIDSYILKESRGPFLFGLSAFTILYVSCGLFFRAASLIIESKASIKVGIYFILNSLPQVIIYTIPMSILLASLLAFGRLSSDCEVIAFKANGISLYRLIIPVMIMSFMLSMITLVFNEFIVPGCSYNARKIAFSTMAVQKIEQLSNNLLIRENSEDGTEKIIYAKKYDLQNGFMEDVVFNEFAGKNPLRVTYADKAVWEDHSWSLLNGKTYGYNPTGEVNSLISFGRTTMSLKKSPRDIADTQKFPEEMTSWEIMDRIKREKAMNLDYHWLEVQYHMKFSSPFICVVFAMIGVPFGLRPHRSSSSMGFGISLLIIFMYYVIMVTFTTLGNLNFVPAFLACWLPNIIFAGAGIYLIKKAAR